MKFKLASQMNKHEIDPNKQNLDAFTRGDHNINAMIPGIQSVLPPEAFSLQNSPQKNNNSPE